jgi:hypothetical protein
MGIPALAILMMAAGQADAPPSSASAPEYPVSVERIGAAMQRPAMKIPPIDPTPVFRATVEGEAPFDNPLQGMRRELAGVSRFPPPPELIGLVMGIVRSIKAAHRAHEEAAIRKEVQEALTAFCAERDCSVLENGPPPLEGIVLPSRGRP